MFLLRSNIFVKEFFLDESVSSVELSEQLKYICGLDNSVLKEPVVAKYLPDLSNTLSNLFVYSDIVKETHVGNKYVNLLRIIPFGDIPFGQNFSRIFPNVQYRPPSTKNSINSISMKILDKQGREYYRTTERHLLFYTFVVFHSSFTKVYL